MARFRGSRSKVARRLGEPVFGFMKSVEKKAYPPGHHGQNRRRRPKSDYAVQLTEKQKAKYTYGLLEKQFRNLYKEASRRKGITGVILLQLLEARLDNTLYRLGVAPTRRAARQLVTHKHIVVNNRSVSIPSYSLKPGDIVGLRKKSMTLSSVHGSLTSARANYPWLEWDGPSMTGKFLDMPEREKIPENIKEQLIVELYSK